MPLFGAERDGRIDAHPLTCGICRGDDRGGDQEQAR